MAAPKSNPPIPLDAGIPLVDLHSPSAPQELLRAASTFGFIFVKHENVAVTSQEVDSMFDLSRRFFSQSEETKGECRINSKTSGKNHGWLSMQTETLDPGKQKRGDLKEAFNLGEFIGGAPQQPLPEPLKANEALLGRFLDNCHQLCNDILKKIAVALDIAPAKGGDGWFEERHDRGRGPSGSILRLLYYPTVPSDPSFDPGEDIRAGAHSDYGSITLLFRLPGQAGLEILTPKGEWATIPVNPSGTDSSQLPILVNIGDLMSFWTNGLLKSAVHRVVFPEQEPRGGQPRYSIAYFCHPLDDAKLVEIPSTIVPSRDEQSAGNDRTVLTARDHLNSRLAATYGF